MEFVLAAILAEHLKFFSKRKQANYDARKIFQIFTERKVDLRYAYDNLDYSESPNLFRHSGFYYHATVYGPRHK